MLLFSALAVALTACEGSDWDRHALTGPESNRLIASVEIEPSGAVIDPDGVEQFSALVKSARGAVVSRNVTWRSLDEDVLKVDASGTVIGMNEGTARLEATHQGVTGQTTVDVHGEVVAIRLSENSLAVDEGEVAQIEATYVYANGAERPAGPLEWRSDDPTILQVDSDGLAQGIRSGVTRVRVRGRGHELFVDGRVRAGTVASVDVVAPATSLAVGEELQFWAEIHDSQGNRLFRPVQWSSSNGSVASVDGAGLVKARQAGQTRIEARSDGISGSVEIQVGSSGSQTEARPSPVSSLSVASTEMNSVTLRFTEVDDGMGEPAAYDIRYAKAPLGWGWGQATSVAKGSCKVPLQGTGIGNARTCTVEGLQPSTKYDFQLVPFRGTMNAGATYGQLSNIVGGTTKDSPIKVEVLPSGVTLDVGTAIQVRASVTDLYGNPLSRSVSWSSSRPSVATVSGSGNSATVTAVDPGDSDVRATTDGVHGISRIRVVRPVSSGSLRANEPSGFSRIAEHDFSCRPASGCALAGVWDETTDSWQQSNLTVVQRSDAPVSGPNVIRTRFPSGLRAGLGPVNFWGWSSPGEEYRSVYVSMWIRIAGSDYQNHPNITKSGWIGYGESGVIGNQGYFGLQTTPGTGRMETVTRLQPVFFQQNHVARAEWASTMINVGEWHHWEMYFDLNDVGRSNGVFRWWINGRLILSKSDMVYVTRGNERGFFQYRWNPTWGGTGDFAKTRDDFMEIDHIYISGRR